MFRSPVAIYESTANGLEMSRPASASNLS